MFPFYNGITVLSAVHNRYFVAHLLVMARRSPHNSLSDRRSYHSKWWRVTLPNHWHGHTDEVCATFTRIQPLGALQISGAKKESGVVTSGDLQQFACEQLRGVPILRTADYGSFSGYVADEVKLGKFWRHWWLASGQLMVYATYNIALGSEHIEGDDVELILSSLRPSVPSRTDCC